MLGLSLSAYLVPGLWLAAGILAAAGAAVWLRRDLWKYILLSTLSVLMACCVYWHAESAFSRQLSHAGETSFTGRIVQTAAYQSGWTRCDLEGTFPDGQRARVEWLVKFGIYGIGDTVTLTGNAEPIVGNELFDSQAFAKSRGVSLHFGFDAEVTDVRRQERFSLRRVLADWRGDMTAAIRRQMRPETGAMLTGMLFGDRSGLTRADRTVLNRTGIGHVLVASGLHLDFLAMAAEVVLRKCRVGRKTEFAVMTVLCVLFVLLAGETIPVRRACIMILIRQSGRVAFRMADALNSLSIAVFLIGVSDPFAVFSGSFWMTVAATFGIAALGPFMTREMPQDTVLQTALADLACGCWAFAAMLPVQAVIFREVSLITPISNTFLLPICVGSMVCGVLAAATGGNGAVPAFFFGGADVLNGWVLRISHAVSDLSWTHAATGSRILLFALLSGALAVILVFAMTRSRKFAAFATAGVLLVTFAACRTEELLHDGEIRVAMFGAESTGLLAVTNGEDAVLVDLSGETGLPAYAEAYLQEEGIGKVEALCLFRPRQRSVQQYEAYLAEFAPDVVRIPETAPDLTAFGQKAGRFGNTELLFHGTRITFGTDEIYMMYRNQQFVFGQDNAGTGEGSCELTFAPNGKCRIRRLYGEN